MINNVGLDFLNLTGKKAGALGARQAGGTSEVHGAQKAQQESYKPDYNKCNGELRPVMKDDQRANRLDFDA